MSISSELQSIFAIQTKSDLNFNAYVGDLCRNLCYCQVLYKMQEIISLVFLMNVMLFLVCVNIELKGYCYNRLQKDRRELSSDKALGEFVVYVTEGRLSNYKRTFLIQWVFVKMFKSFL